MSRRAAILFLSLLACAFGGKKPEVASGPQPVESASLRLDLQRSAAKQYQLVRTGEIVFQGKIPGETMRLSCAIPVEVATRISDPRSFGASLSKGAESIYSKLESPGAGEMKYELRSGFFRKEGEVVNDLRGGTLGQLEGEYEISSLTAVAKGSSVTEIAAVNAHGVGFVLPLSGKFKGTAFVTISPARKSAESNLFCKEILERGFSL